MKTAPLLALATLSGCVLLTDEDKAAKNHCTSDSDRVLVGEDVDGDGCIDEGSERRICKYVLDEYLGEYGDLITNEACLDEALTDTAESDLLLEGDTGEAWNW
jgi:hypothetical protein